jgi:hypothetical protein
MRLAVVVVAAMACGPSNAEVKTARTASYHATPANLLEIAQQVTSETYQVASRTDDELVTAPRFYSATGELESTGAGNVVQVRAGSVRVVFHIKVVPSGAEWFAIEVTPDTLQVVEGSPQPRHLAPDDPYLPPFVLGRADSLALAIYERAKPYATK